MKYPYQQEELFVPFDLALIVKMLGFEEPCFNFYSTHGNGEKHLQDQPIYCNKAGVSPNVIAPLWTQVVDWLNKEHEIDVIPIPEHKSDGRIKMRVYTYTIYSNGNGKVIRKVGKKDNGDVARFSKKENALRAGVEEALLKLNELSFLRRKD